MKLNEIRPDLNFELYSSPINEADPTLKEKYWDKYWALPDEVLKQHNFWYAELGNAWKAEDKLLLAYDENNQIALMRVHTVVDMPEVKHYGAYCLFIKDRVILISTVYEGPTNCNFENKTEDTIVQIASLDRFNINDGLSLNNEFNEILLKSFSTFLLRRKSNVLTRESIILELKKDSVITQTIITAKV